MIVGLYQDSCNPESSDNPTVYVVGHCQAGEKQLSTGFAGNSFLSFRNCRFASRQGFSLQLRYKEGGRGSDATERGPMATEGSKEENEASRGKPTTTRSNKKRKNKDVFIYGNYKSYYGYRIDQNAKEDPRLAVFKKEWFEGKDCLDIGCNQGIVTIAIAKKFRCRSIVGIDIDQGLINAANWNLGRTSRRASSNKEDVKGVSENAGNHPVKDEPVVNEEMDLSKVVSFRRENFVEHPHVSSAKYDTIVCLSVSKWIHLNWGDEGIITLFVKIWRLLRPGGVFVLEPQPWNSYKRNRLVSETARVNFQRIFLHPGKFREILLDKIGFRSAEVITDKLTGTVAGFDRPITAFYK